MTQPKKMLDAIRSRVTEIGITQTELGKRCGWTQSLVSRYLSGQKEPGMESLTKLAKAVGCEWMLITEKRKRKNDRQRTS
jgi:transcriptional regulator with XRE-family HTH domain